MPVLCAVSASNIKNASGAKIQLGVIEFTPVNLQGTPIDFLFSGGGIGGSGAVMASINNGAFSISLPDTSATTPTNVAFRVRAWDSQTGAQIIGPGYETFQPSGSSMNFDTVAPNLPGVPLVTTIITGGGGGSSPNVFAEVPAPTGDPYVFTLSVSPTLLSLTRGPLFQYPGVDFDISGNSITFKYLPPSEDKLYAQGLY